MKSHTRTVAGAVSLALSAPVMGAACPPTGNSWTDVTPASRGLPGRWDHAMAYDHARANTLVFGGANGPGGQSVLGDTWTWNGASWTQRLTAAPSARRAHAMAYDSQRQRVVLFGGFNGANVLGDTWEWNGSTWTHRTSSGPVARSGHSMVYDGARGRVVMFGGHNGVSFLPDTWEWDGNNWNYRTNNGPAARQHAGMTYDTARYRTVLFGGFNGNSLSDTWEWNGSSWSLRQGAGPSPRYAPAMAFSTFYPGAVLFGGYHNGTLLGDTWIWNGTVWTRMNITGPSARWASRMVTDHPRERLVLVGGADSAGFRNDTWELSLALPNDSCAAPALIAPGATAVDLTCATDGPSGCANLRDVWFFYSPPVSSTVTVSVTSPFFSPVIAVYNGTSCPPGAPLACTAGAMPTVVFGGNAGSIYLIRVGSHLGAPGTGTLTLQQQPVVCPPVSSQVKREKLYYITGSSNNIGWSW